MLSIQNSISIFILLNVFTHIKGLVELPVVEDNNLATAERTIRNTVDSIFAIFKIDDVKQRLRLKQFSLIHDFFVSITLTDCNNLKEIARLTRVNNIDNNTEHFITQINEVLNEDDKSYEANDTNNVHVTKYIGMFIRKLKYLKEMYVSNRNTVLNANILKYLSYGQKEVQKATKTKNVSTFYDSNESIFDDDPFWKPNSRRIYQGIRTSIKRFPFMASVLFFKKFQCAGSIIKSDLVITSASCLQLAWNNRFFRENPAFLSVQVGSNVYEGSGDNIAVLEVYFNPGYDPKTLRNNLALMRLTRRIIFKKKRRRVKKIDFDRNPWPLPVNSPRIIVIGWGAKDINNVISNVYRNKLSYAKLDYYPLPECQEHYSEDFVTEKNFCAGFFSKGGGACNRDAGGPGVIEDKLVGVISFGSPICGAPDAPTVFTKLGFYTDWIETIMEEEVPHTYQMTTTLAPNKNIWLDTYTETTTKLNIVPVVGTTTQIPVPALSIDHLRIAQEQGFKDFLATLFSKDDIKEYFDKPIVDVNETINVDVPNTNVNNKEMLAELLQNPETEATVLITEDTTALTTLFANQVEHSDEIKSETGLIIETTTEYTEIVTVLEDASNEKHLEKDIMTLIDNLDINKILHKEKLEYTSPAEIDLKDDKDNTNISETDRTNVTSSVFGENQSNISPQQQTTRILNVSSSPHENKDKDVDVNEELVHGESFLDLTFRDRPNKTKKHNGLSESAFYELISLALDDETKQLHKAKRYSL